MIIAYWIAYALSHTDFSDVLVLTGVGDLIEKWSDHFMEIFFSVV